MRKQLPGGIELRELASDDEYEAVVDLERETWGVGFEDTVPDDDPDDLAENERRSRRRLRR